jgi:hypothetical protein
VVRLGCYWIAHQFGLKPAGRQTSCMIQYRMSLGGGCAFLLTGVIGYVVSTHRRHGVAKPSPSTQQQAVHVRCAFSGRNPLSRSAVEFHAFAPLDASKRVTNGIPLGCPLLLPVGSVNSVQTLKVTTVSGERVQECVRRATDRAVEVVKLIDAAIANKGKP